MKPPIFTIGHSTRPIETFVALLSQCNIGCVVDIRAIPRSRTNPQYNQDMLAEALRQSGVDYRHMAALGGRRGKSRDVAPNVNGYWTNGSFHNYADYALTDAFRDALSELRALAHDKRCAIMCSEAVWWRCHRRVVTDYLLHAGETVLHIVSADRVELSRITPNAVGRPDGALAYPLST